MRKKFNIACKTQLWNWERSNKGMISSAINQFTKGTHLHYPGMISISGWRRASRALLNLVINSGSPPLSGWWLTARSLWARLTCCSVRRPVSGSPRICRALIASRSGSLPIGHWSRLWFALPGLRWRRLLLPVPVEAEPNPPDPAPAAVVFFWRVNENHAQDRHNAPSLNGLGELLHSEGKLWLNQPNVVAVAVFRQNTGHKHRTSSNRSKIGKPDHQPESAQIWPVEPSWPEKWRDTSWSSRQASESQLSPFKVDPNHWTKQLRRIVRPEKCKLSHNAAWGMGLHAIDGVVPGWSRAQSGW